MEMFCTAGFLLGAEKRQFCIRSQQQKRIRVKPSAKSSSEEEKRMKSRVRSLKIMKTCRKRHKTTAKSKPADSKQADWDRSMTSHGGDKTVQSRRNAAKGT